MYDARVCVFAMSGASDATSEVATLVQENRKRKPNDEGMVRPCSASGRGAARAIDRERGAM